MDDRPEQTEKTAAASYSTAPRRWSLPTPSLPKLRRSGRYLSARLRQGLLNLFCLLVGLGGGYMGAVWRGGQASNPTVQKQTVSSESQLISQIAKTVGASVVSIDVQAQVSTPTIFGFNQIINQQAAGTGFIASSDGIVVTNRHVVAGATTVSVTLADGTRLTGVSVIGQTPATSSLDVAFLKINDAKGKKLTPVNLGDSSKMEVGDRVVAIGNALGQFQNTVTSGIISGYGRSLTAGDQSSASSESLTDLFQTDAAINPGNSGGPLVNINGEVIGLNTAVASGAQNIGFSIPINDVKGLINTVLAKGKLELPFLGVHYVPLTPDIAYQYNLSVNRGAYVVSGDGSPAVLPDSPAAKAGIQEKDVITKVNDTTIDDKTSLTGALAQHQVGDSVTLTINRGAKTMTLHATLAATP